MSEEFLRFQEHLIKHFCYNCDGDKGSCKNDKPKCIAFVFKHARRIDHMNDKKMEKKYNKFFSEWEHYKMGGM